MRYIIHTFRPSETIDAIIKLRGRHNFTVGEMKHLRKRFDELNGKTVPRAGMSYKIPLPFEITDDYGDLIDTTPPWSDENE